MLIIKNTLLVVYNNTDTHTMSSYTHTLHPASVLYYNTSLYHHQQHYTLFLYSIIAYSLYIYNNFYLL